MSFGILYRSAYESLFMCSYQNKVKESHSPRRIKNNTITTNHRLGALKISNRTYNIDPI